MKLRRGRCEGIPLWTPSWCARIIDILSVEYGCVKVTDLSTQFEWYSVNCVRDFTASVSCERISPGYFWADPTRALSEGLRGQFLATSPPNSGHLSPSCEATLCFLNKLRRIEYWSFPEVSKLRTGPIAQPRSAQNEFGALLRPLLPAWHRCPWLYTHESRSRPPAWRHHRPIHSFRNKSWAHDSPPHNRSCHDGCPSEEPLDRLFASHYLFLRCRYPFSVGFNCARSLLIFLRLKPWTGTSAAFKLPDLHEHISALPIYEFFTL